MENANSVYQRAVTPTMDATGVGAGSSIVRGKMLSYQSNQMRRNVVAPKTETSSISGSVSGSNLGTGQSLSRAGTQLLGNTTQSTSSQLKHSSGFAPQHRLGGVPSTDMNVQGRAASSISTMGGLGNSIKTMAVGGVGVGVGVPYSNNSASGLPAVPGSGGIRPAGGSETQYSDHAAAQSLATLPRYDLYPLSDEIPSDGIIFAKVRNQTDSLVVFRTPEERLRNPERLNLDRRQLDVCPLLEQEQRLRLLNFQNNSIRSIQNLENLPNLIFLDIYNNKLSSLEGPLSTVKGLRVLMAGKNRIGAISNLTQLRKLDVLDLHSNEIRQIEGLEGLTDLRVLNLAGNRIAVVQHLVSLQALTELNLRRNSIERVHELDKLPALQRIFLSHNLLTAFTDIQCLFNVKFLVELSLDGNPLSESDPTYYRNKIVSGMTGLKHLDLKRITDTERSQAVSLINSQTTKEQEEQASNLGAAALASGNTYSEFPEIIPPVIVSSNPEPLSDVAQSRVDESVKQDVKFGDPVASSSGLAALARAGRIASTHSLFDLEVRITHSLAPQNSSNPTLCSMSPLTKRL